MEKSHHDIISKQTNYDLTKFYVAGLGASAGGHQALFDFFENIPQDSQIAFIVIMHLKRDYESKLDMMLSKHTKLKVIKVKGYELIKPNHIYVIPENNYIEIFNRQLFLKRRPLKDLQNNAIDVFFDSLANDVKDNSIGIIFSGMGTDGSIGIRHIEQQGGIVLVQNPNTAKFDAMPYCAIRMDHPDYISFPGDIGKNLMNIISYKNNSLNY